jgi:hypothetical protein
MTTYEYEQWWNHHATLFALGSAQDAALANAWEPMLRDYSLQELTEASNSLARMEPVPFRTQHLALLRRKITEAKLAFQEAQDRANEIQGVICPLCENTGWVSVPHLKYVINGVWQPLGNYYPAYNVLCSCAKGESLLNKQRIYREDKADLIAACKRKDPMSMSLDNYLQKNPFWREQVAERKALEKHEVKAKSLAVLQDKIGQIGRMPE